MRLHLITCAWFLLLLTACVPVGPDYQPPQSHLPAAFTTLQETEPQHVPGDNRTRWWGLFNDPLLLQLVDQALAANQDLHIAESRIKAARARYLMTEAAADPSLAAAGLYSQSQRSDNTGSSSNTGSQDLFQAGFDADWELDIFGGQRRSIEAAAATLSASEENRRDVLISLEAEVARNYFELRGSQRRLATARNNLIAQEKTLASVEGRYGLGLVSKLEVAQTQTQKSLLAATLPALDQKIASSTGQLALLLNMQLPEIAPLLSTSTTPPDLPLYLPTGLPSDLLRRRPDIRRAERQLAAATAEIGVATADLFPRFSLSGLVGLQSSSLSDLVSSGSRFWSYGPSFNLPLFNRQKLKAAVTITEAQREEMQASYEKTVLSALIETENALIQFAREQETRGSLASAVQTGRQAVKLNEGLYSSGLTDLTDVLSSQRTQYQAEDQLIQSEQQLALSSITLYKALGGGWEIAEQTTNATSANGQEHQRTQQSDKRP